jgi:hypothetical protein
MMNNYELALEMAKSARLDFGAMLLNWRRLNGWTQYTACNWAKESGFEIISYGNLSVIEQGKAGELRQKVFLQLDELNARVAEKNLTGIKTQKIRKLVEAAIPIGDEDVPVWSVLEFIACYMGLRPVPKKFQIPVSPPVSQKKATEISNAVRKQFHLIVAEQGEKNSFESLTNLMKIAGPDHQHLFCSVLLGADYTPTQLMNLYVDRSAVGNTNTFKPFIWLVKLQFSFSPQIDYMEQDFTIPAPANP